MLIKRKPRKKFRWLASELFIVAGLAVIIFLGVAAGKETYRKYQIQKEINSLQREADKINEKNQELGRLIDYFQTDAYKELEARKEFGLQKEGEKVVIIKRSPENYIGKTSNFGSGDNEDVSNARKWWRYFFKDDYLLGN